MSITSVAPFQRKRPLLSLATRRTPVELEPEDKTVQKLEGFYQQCKDYRDGDLQMADRWRSHRAWYLSTGADRGMLDQTMTYVNLIYEKVEKLSADVTEAMPSFLFRAKGREGLKLSEHLNLSVPQVWRDSEGDALYRESVKADHIYGSWFWKIDHDPGYGGRGPKVRLRSVPCHRFFPAPFATSIQKALGVVELSLRTVEEIENDYGIRVNPELTPDDLPDIAEDLGPVRYRSGIAYGSNIGTVEGVPGPNQVPMHAAALAVSGRVKTAGYVFQKEAWFYDPTLESKYWLEMGDAGPELRHGKDLAYPRGRVVSWANGRRLYDRENQYLDGRFPYVRFIDNPYPEHFWGLGEIPNLITLQLLHDDIVDTMRLIHAYMANGKLIIDKTTGLRDREVGNDPGEVLWTNRGTHDRIKWLPGMSPPAEFYQHLLTIERWFDLLTGSFDVTRGVNPTGVTAARALVALQRAAGIRVRGRMRENEDSLKSVGHMIASRIRQFAPGRMEVLGGDGTIVPLELHEEDRNAEVDLKVDVVSNLEDLKAAEFQKLLLFKNMNLVGDERLIKDSGLSSAETLLAELPEMRMKQLAMLTEALLKGQSMGVPTGTVTPAAQAVVEPTKAVNRSLRTAQGGSE